jgi:AraC-like DNA-binding protein
VEPIGAVERARVVQKTVGGTRWEVALRPPAPALRPYIRDFYGYTERAEAVLRRREFPGPQVVVIFDLGPPIRILDDLGRAASRFPGGFVAGLGDRFALSEHDGLQRGIQLNLTPVGARLFFGIPMSELTGRVVSFGDLMPREHRSLVERLDAEPDWDARFDLIERLVAERVGRARRNQIVDWAYARIEGRGGALEIGGLADELGYSQTHLIKLFKEHVGVAPKVLARIIRFDRLMRHLKRGGSGSWADLALAFGYYDQAHLVREIRQFTGATPSSVKSMLIDLTGLTGLNGPSPAAPAASTAPSATFPPPAAPPPATQRSLF